MNTSVQDALHINDQWHSLHNVYPEAMKPVVSALEMHQRKEPGLLT